VAHLMLRQDVVDAAAAGKFHIYPMETVDDALELLTGMAVGTPDANGMLPEGSLNQRVAQRIKHLAELRHKFAKKTERGSGASHEKKNE
jgi:predicted ATP-dependent protease